MNKTWEVINDLFGKNTKPSNLPSELFYENKTYVKPQEVINNLNLHFTKIGKHDSNIINFDSMAKTVRWNPNSIFFHRQMQLKLKI